jgi:ubiquinone/menaquinone biosynthesis C-methylase UbiE
MAMFLKRDNPYLLVVGMAGVKLGDRMVQVGCGSGGRLGALAAISGLSGHAAAVVPDASSAARARKGAADAGALVEVEIAPATRLPLEDGSFDLVVVDDTTGVVGSLRAEDRVASVREFARVLRPGGRVVLMGTAPRGGLGGLIFRAQSGPPWVASGEAVKALEADGFKPARLLAEREGLAFAEAIKPR